MKLRLTSWLEFIITSILVVMLALPGCKKVEDTVDTFIDARDGQEYKMITIGDQVWMAENLNYATTTGISWCYDNVESTCEVRGRLYDFISAWNACPVGWHLPTYAELSQLSEFLGGDLVSGGKLKTAGFDHWYAPNIGATNESGFSAQPFGRRISAGEYEGYGQLGYWWSSAVHISGDPISYFLEYSTDELDHMAFPDDYCLSVRCVMD